MSDRSPAPLILASESQTRARMLRDAGVSIESVPARVDEASVKAALAAEGAPALDVADTLAEMKALRISGRRPEALVLGADQVLVCEGRLYDKPDSREAAAAQLKALRGKSHDLISAAVVARGREPIWRHAGRARLTMRPFTDAFLERYLDQAGEAVTWSVGAYQLEAAGAQLFARVSGDYFTILGLPLLELLGFLRMQEVLVE